MQRYNIFSKQQKKSQKKKDRFNQPFFSLTANLELLNP